MIDGILSGLSVAFLPFNLLMVFVGCFVGTFIGMLPGLGPLTAIALMIPITYGYDPSSALILMAGVYYGAMYGGSTASILLNDPGADGTVAACYEGYPLARKGMAGKALAVAAYGSFIGGTIATLCLMVAAPLVALFVDAFQSADYFVLIVMGLIAVAASNGPGQFLKAIMMAIIGLMLATVGQDVGSNTPRFTFGNQGLLDGLSYVLLAMALFANSEALMTVLKGHNVGAAARQATDNFGTLRLTRDERRQMLPAAWRASFLGFFVGVLPGAGAAIASFLAYGLEKRLAKPEEKREFGHGSIRGLSAPETANNAACSGSFLPLLTLGIPGSGATAIMLSALISYGVAPGPGLMIEQPAVFWSVIISMYLGNVILLILNLPLVPYLAKLLTLPTTLVVPVLLFITIAGVYLISLSTLDIYVMVALALMAVFMRLFNYPMTPLFLGFVLGKPMEAALQRALAISDGSMSFLWDRPLTLCLTAVAIAIILFASLRGVQGTQGGMRAGEGA